MQTPKNLDGIPWLAAGYRELRMGVGRYGSVGAKGQYVPVYDTDGHVRNNPRIVEYLKATTTDNLTERTSWCSAFVNWCVRQGGVAGTRSAAARSWLSWHGGEVLREPRIGAVVVFPRPPNPAQGHVAMIWNIGAHGLEVLGGNQGAHAANAKHHTDAVSSHVSIAHRAASTALGYRWPKGFAHPDEGTRTNAGPGEGMSILILRGIAGHYGGRDWPRGALDEPPALEYARRRGYVGKVLDVAGATGSHSPQTRMALDEFRRDQTVAGLYGFSGGGYNVLHIIHALTPAERARLRLVVVLGAPRNPSTLYRGPWELVYRHDPPGGHMDGPRALLATLH
jgi:uncharacterized protein (TIGR02594 family)